MRVSVDPVSLDTIPDPQSGFLRQVFFLHSTLLLKNREGRQLVGWLGVASWSWELAVWSIGGLAAASGGQPLPRRGELAGSSCIASCMVQRAFGVCWFSSQ
jgi:hypothetical protein